MKDEPWRLVVIWYMAQAYRVDARAARMDRAGLHVAGGQLREIAAGWRDLARDRIPARARPAWQRAVSGRPDRGDRAGAG